MRVLVHHGCDDISMGTGSVNKHGSLPHGVRVLCDIVPESLVFLPSLRITLIIFKTWFEFMRDDGGYDVAPPSSSMVTSCAHQENKGFGIWLFRKNGRVQGVSEL